MQKHGRAFFAQHVFYIWSGIFFLHYFRHNLRSYMSPTSWSNTTFSVTRLGDYFKIVSYKVSYLFNKKFGDFLKYYALLFCAFWLAAKFFSPNQTTQNFMWGVFLIIGSDPGFDDVSIWTLMSIKDLDWINEPYSSYYWKTFHWIIRIRW